MNSFKNPSPSMGEGQGWGCGRGVRATSAAWRRRHLGLLSHALHTPPSPALPPSRGKRALFAVLAALALSACYASNTLLLDPDAAAHPLADGVYERADAEHERIQLTREADGWYDVEQFNANGTIGETRKVLLNPLDAGGLKAFAAAEQGDDGFTYAVVVVQGERVFLATPDCADPLDASLAVDHGGEQEDDDAMTHNCVFRTREAVMTALADFVGQADFGAPYLKH
jgi:hypothetical protein